MPVQFDELAEYLKGLPNSFSPNGDDINECFDLRKKLNLRIAAPGMFTIGGERWSFRARGHKHCWNGRKDTNGEPCPTGTYFYVLKIVDTSFKGSITLFR
ncbi:MAG: gliding motility-associated C-terminal domain-containing protein [Bacteroidetes bacterium]|nr:gliding motility-associated C-terminal domain-containing protein [Bacteroidota bacterium]